MLQRSLLQKCLRSAQPTFQVQVQNPVMLQLINQQQRSMSIFSSIFGKKEKKEEEKKFEKVAEQKQEEEVAEAKQEPTKYHKKSKAEQQAEALGDIKDEIRQLDRSGEGNMYTKYKRVRETIKEKNTNLERHIHPDLLNNSRVSIQKFEKNIFKRGLEKDEEPFPVSPRIGPYEVEKPLLGAKNYYWCSCGQSLNQPFCDSTHQGSLFKPVKFSLDEKSDRLHLCGCKLSTQKPFCDGDTCRKILGGDKFEAAERLMDVYQQEKLEHFDDAGYENASKRDQP